MSEVFSPTSNSGQGSLVGGVSSAENGRQIILRVNPTTKRLLVDASVTVSGLATAVTDGEAVDIADVGNLALGTDGSNYQIISTDADGHLQVDVLTGGGGGTQYTEGDTDATITGTALMFEGAANTLVAAPGTAADGLLVNLGANNDVVVTNAGTFAVQADTELTTADLDTGVGTDTRAVVGLVGSKSGGGELIPGSAADGLLVNLGANNDVVVTNAGTFAVQVDGAALTALQLIDNLAVAVDGNYLNVNMNFAGVDAPTGAGTEAGVLRVTIATDSTGVLSVDDNGGSLTVDGTVTANLAAGTNNIGDVDILTIAAGDNNIGNVDIASAIPAGTNAIGKLIPPDFDVNGNTNKAQKYYTNAGAVTDGIIWSPAAGKRWHVTLLYIQVSAAATVTVEDDLVAGDNAVWKGELAANSGVVLPFGDMYPLASTEDAADLLITTTAGNVYVTAVGYEI